MDKAIDYRKYLQLDTLINIQNPESASGPAECHDETLFIITHQVYELWFKQILHELDAIIRVFNKSAVDEHDLFRAVAWQLRVIEIQKILIAQLTIMETMTAMDFLEFRDLLIPASGFQSVQFRLIEIKLGLGTANRSCVDRNYLLSALDSQDQQRIDGAEREPSLFGLVEAWLERIPFIAGEGFDFWALYQEAVDAMLDGEARIVSLHSRDPKSALSPGLSNVEASRRNFASLFDQGLHDNLVRDGQRRLSRKAMLSALFILLYREEPILQLPFNFLTNLMDIDENFTAWRYRHALMAHRMLGRKVGTGGSSGHEYLKKTAEESRFFEDLFNLSTFLLPRSKLPVLSKALKRDLNFHFESKN
ncbi:MAG: tryptophan 2,3-dioxygenase [Gammaproteobacteria bacterium]|nr:MAG: tryptophan 2,3-dioxygenase [Gammaproteobacteria bacterium]PCJ18824.1 MAG: tryptophan 2,3-dioxygenase [Gammaproteobacteria bacterium]